MVYLYYCKACEDGDHGHCELSTPPPVKGMIGGRKCRCSCSGDPLWANVDEKLKEDFRRILSQEIKSHKLSDE